jgi:hypothetical protein
MLGQTKTLGELAKFFGETRDRREDRGGIVNTVWTNVQHQAQREGDVSDAVVTVVDADVGSGAHVLVNGVLDVTRDRVEARRGVVSPVP